MSSDNLVTNFMKTTVMNLTKCLKSSFDLPVKGHSEESIFNDFPQYKKVLNGLSLKVLNNIQQLIDKQDGKGNLLDTTEKKSLDDKFNILVEVNDRLLDKCNNLIYMIENPDSKPVQQMIMVEYNNKVPQLLKDGSKMTPKQTIKLLSSVQVERPQTKFAKYPDNSKISFRPILSKKPNALQSLEESLVNSDDENYPHPYKMELDSFIVPEQQLLTTINPEFPKSLEETPYEYIESIEQLQNLINTLKTVKEISVDLEHHNVRTYLGLTCLIQISTRSSDYIIDTLSLHDHLEILNEIFTDPGILKVFHGSNSDLMWLQRDFGVYVVNLFDTGHACELLNFPRKSLSYLLEKYCQIQANKEYQRLTDWRIRPLIPELIEYARTDTHYLLFIYEMMKKELFDRNLIENSFKVSHNLCYKLYYKPTINLEECSELYKKSSETFNPRQLYALKRLWELRDNIAREEDESCQFVLPNRILIAIAQNLPRETSGILACCSQDWKLPLLRKYVYDFQKICLEAYNESLVSKEKKITVKKDILDFLLSKHDRTETADDNLQIIIDSEQVDKKIKDNQSILWRNWSKSEPFGVDMVKTYLKYHQMDSVDIKPVENDNQSDLIADEEIVEKSESDAEIIEIDQSVNNNNLPQSTENSTGNLTLPFVDLNECKKLSNKRARPMKNKPEITPYNYDKSIIDLTKLSKSDKTDKQFQPFKTKKFKKSNQRKF